MLQTGYLRRGKELMKSRIEALIKQQMSKAYNFVSPIYSVDIRFGGRSWRIVTEAGNAQNEFERSIFVDFHAFARANPESKYTTAYLTQFNVYNQAEKYAPKNKRPYSRKQIAAEEDTFPDLVEQEQPREVKPEDASAEPKQPARGKGKGKAKTSVPKASGPKVSGKRFKAVKEASAEQESDQVPESVV